MNIKELAVALQASGGGCQCDDCDCSGCVGQREAYIRKLLPLLGFTRDDVAYIRAAANASFLPNALVKPLELVAKRVESILPPEPAK